MIVMRRGTRMPQKKLIDVLQEQHEAAVESQRERMAKRAKRHDVPPVTDKEPEAGEKVPEEEQIGEFSGYDYLADIEVRFVALPLGRVRDIRIDWLAAIADASVDDGAKAKAAVQSGMQLKREALVEMVGEVHGLADESGPLKLVAPLSDEDLDLIEDARLLEPLFEAGLYVQDLSVKMSKKSGASQLSTSAPQHSTATPVPLLCDEEKGATATALPASGATTVGAT